MPDGKDAFGAASTILLVDDEENILSSLSRLLEEEDYQVFTAQSAEIGLQVLRQQKIDLVISDMRMPNVDGATFLTQVAQQWPDTSRILLTGFADINSTIRAINEGKISQYISKPWDDEELLTQIDRVLEVNRLRNQNRQLLLVKEQQRRQLQELTEQQEAVIKSRTAELEQTALQIETAYDELQESYFQSVPLLAQLIELNEHHKKQHANRVAQITQIMSSDMALSDAQRRQFYVGAILHDIGKIGIEKNVFLQSIPKMSGAELRAYQQHPLLGESVMLSFDPFRDAAQIVRSHHERFDGKGFPSKLAGEAIPLGARVVAVANDYDNLQLPNNFLDRALSDAEAYEFILQESGKRYDPGIVAVFERVWSQIKKQLSSDRDITLTLEKAKPSMILSQDLINHHGLVMLAAGKTLTEGHIRKLNQFEKEFDTRLTLSVRYSTEEDTGGSPV